MAGGVVAGKPVGLVGLAGGFGAAHGGYEPHNSAMANSSGQGGQGQNHGGQGQNHGGYEPQPTAASRLVAAQTRGGDRPSSEKEPRHNGDSPSGGDRPFGGPPGLQPPPPRGSAEPRRSARAAQARGYGLRAVGYGLRRPIGLGGPPNEGCPADGGGQAGGGRPGGRLGGRPEKVGHGGPRFGCGRVGPEPAAELRALFFRMAATAVSFCMAATAPEAPSK